MHTQKKLLMGVLLFVFATLGCVALGQQTALAATLTSQEQLNTFVGTLQFVDSGTIVGKVDSQNITFKRGSCGATDYTGQGCFVAPDLYCGTDKARISRVSATATPFGGQARDPGYYLTVSISAGGSCNSAQTVKLNLATSEAQAGVLASRLNAETIITRSNVGGISSGEKFIKIGAESSNVYGRDKESGDKCQDFIRVVGNKATIFEIKDSTSGHSLKDAGVDSRNDCEIISINGNTSFDSDAEARRLSLPANGFTLGTITEEELAAEGGTETQQEDPCDSAGGLSWIICPVIELGYNMTDFVFKDLIQPLLEDIPVSTDPDNKIYKAWQSFRTIGNIILVGTLMAVVYAQIRGDR